MHALPLLRVGTGNTQPARNPIDRSKPQISKGEALTKPRLATALLTLLASAVALIVLPSSASAGRNLDVGFVGDRFGDNLLTNESAKVRDKWFNRLKKTNSSIVRINVYWNQMVGGSPPKAPKNPNDPSYVFFRTDAAVLDAKQRGLTPVLTVLGAPRWAEGKNPPSGYRVGSWKPNAKMFGQFATAVAKRYSGKWRGDYGERLPRVKFYEAWNEPNLPQYLAPQWKGKKPKSPQIYRRLVNKFYKGVNKVRKSNKVVAAGTSPFGDRRGGKRMRPYYFWREVLCLKNRKKLRKNKKCAKPKKNRAHFDIYAHNPINAKKGKGPKSKSPHPDDGVPANFKALGRIVRKAEKKKTLLPKKRNRPGWATETWYESKPPEKKAVGLKKQARFMQQALYVLWKQKADAVFFLQIRDSEYDPALPPLVGFQTGVYLPNGKPKPSLKAVRFPFVADRKSKKKVVVWGIAPKSGRVKITQKGRGKRKVAGFRVKEGKVFKKKVRMKKTRGKHRMQAKVKGKKSLKWKQK